MVHDLHRWVLAAAMLACTPLGAQADSTPGTDTAAGAAGEAGALAVPARPHDAPAPVLAAPGLKVVVSLEARRLWLMDGQITLFGAPVAVGRGTRLSDGRRTWDFSTPVGRHRVRRKEENPVWIPPDWHYVEVARERGLALVALGRDRVTPLADGSRLLVRGSSVVRLRAGGEEEIVPAGDEVIFGDTLFIPPLGVANRVVAGELGRFRLDLGDGYMLHGTPHTESIGTAATHGCIRLLDADIEHLYRHVPVGTPVYVY
jgi:L,D-transpeptidase catalytic domain